MRASALPVSLSEVTLNSTTATAAMGTITMIVKKMKSRPRKDIGPPLYRQALEPSFALQASYVLHQVGPVLVEVVRRKCLARVVRPDRAGSAGRRGTLVPAARSPVDPRPAAAAGRVRTPRTRGLTTANLRGSSG